MYNILVVDDEQNVLNALRRELSDVYRVETFTSPQEALQRARETEFALVVSDYRMPDMDGVTFLEHFGQMQPDAVRLVLSGQTDMDALIKAVNLTHIYRFLSKPWNSAELKADIRQGLEYRDAILESRRCAAAYRQGFGIPPLSPTPELHRVLLVSPDENILTALWHELTHHSAYEGLYGAIHHEMTHRPTPGIHDFPLMVDSITSPREALEILTGKHYDLIIAEHSMPEINGVAFFGDIRQSGHDSACILIGEGLDIPTLTRAINQIHIDSFLRQNWSGYELKSAVMRALRYRDLLRENRALTDLLREKT